MNVLFDHQTFSLQNYGGISRYFSELMNGINSHSHYNAHLPVIYSDNSYLRHEQKKSLLPSFNFPKKPTVLYSMNKFNAVKLLKLHKYDVFHPTYYDPYFIKYLNKKPFTVTFLDMIHEKFSHIYKELNHDKELIVRKRILAKESNLIIAISQSTKNDIVSLLNINPEKIKVIHLGSSFRKQEDRHTQNLFKFESRPYFLFVGNRGFYKNFNSFIQALTPVLKRYDINLVCAGGGNFKKDEIRHINQLKIESRVFQQTINDSILAELYNNAIAFVFPSMYEGFGIPVLEAFACNCPCILSNTSSLPEVGGDAALYMDPYSIESMENAVEAVLIDESLRKEMVNKGRERLKQFSWQKTTQGTLDLYKAIA